MKPILFNTEMVRAIMDERKTVTRRVVKPQRDEDMDGNLHEFSAVDGENRFVWADRPNIKTLIKLPYQIGDILYVRETWSKDDSGEYVYRTNYGTTEDDSFPPSMFKWHPSIHMPKEAARLFLQVTDVWAERLQDITKRQAADEGQPGCSGLTICGGPSGCYLCEAAIENSIKWFSEIWDSTIKPTDLPLYGWDANPWVWVIEFERCEKPKEEMKPNE